MEGKISFVFKKLPKKTAVIGVKPPEEKKVELIECLDASSIKIIGHVEEDKKALVIPMQGASKNLLDRIKEANDLKERSRIRYRPNGNEDCEEVKPIKTTGWGEIIDLRPDSELSIDELAARRLLEEARNHEKKKTAVKVTTIALEDQLILEGAKESTMDDYDSVPINDFGMAMLRGMGWTEEQGVGKKKVDAPQLRPKGMGLGASVPGNTRNKIPLDKNGKELKLIKDAKARIIAGKEKGNYCIVQGLDDDAGRIIVKTSLAGTVLSLNEFMLFPVSDDEYAKFSKVLNNAKFDKYSKKSDENLRKQQINKEKSKTDEANDSVEYVPNGNNEKIELSSESEGEKEKYKQQIHKHDKVKKERRSRSKSPDRITNKSKTKSGRASRRSRTKSRSSSPSRGRSLKRRERSTSRSRTMSRSRSRSKNNSSRSKSERRHRDKNDSDSDDKSSTNEDYKPKKRDKKSKKSKKHKNKKDKKSKKEKKKSRRRSSSASSHSTDDDDRSSSKTRRRR